MLSPTQFEDKYISRERTLYAWFARKNFVWAISFSIILGFFIGLVHWEIASLHPTIQSLFYIAPHVARALLILLASSLVFIHMSPGLLRRYLPIFTLIFSICAGYLVFMPKNWDRSSLLAVAFIPVMLILAASYNEIQKRLRNSPAIFVLYTVLHFFWVFSVLSSLENAGLYQAVAYLFGFKCVLFWFWVSSRTHKGDLSLLELSIPMNATRAWPWPSRDTELLSPDQTERRTIWWNGYFNILLGYTLLSIVAVFMLSFAIHYQNLFVNYVTHVLVDIGTLNIIVGGARIFGFKLIDGTFFSFLAKSPAELWRRGSVYNFKFNQEFVFWPAIRIVKNYWVALFIAFSMFYLNALTYESLITLVGNPNRTDEMQSKLELARALSFALHFGLICLPSRIWSFRYMNLSESRRQWAGIVATHVCSLVILYLAYTAATGLLTF